MPLDVHYHLSSEVIENFKAIDNRVLVEVFDTRNKTESGIELPITQDNPFVPNNGIVVCISDDCKLDGIEVGDHIVFSEYKGNRVYSDDGREFILLKSDYILAKIQ